MAIPIVDSNSKNEILEHIIRLLELTTFPKVAPIDRVKITEHLTALRMSPRDMDAQVTFQTNEIGSTMFAIGLKLKASQ
jgi:hypothetical protein